MSLSSIKSILEDLKVLFQRSLNLLQLMHVYYIYHKPNYRNLFHQLSLQLRNLINQRLLFLASLRGQNIIWILSNIRCPLSRKVWQNVQIGSFCSKSRYLKEQNGPKDVCKGGRERKNNLNHYFQIRKWML